MDDFEAAVQAAAHDLGCKGIGTLGEKSLHLSLKYYFAPDPETHERPLGNFVADAVTEDGVVEIQTRSLSRLKPKLEAFLPLCPVTVVHPVAADKWVCKVSEDGELLSRRKSPRHESVYSAMREIYTLRDYLLHPRFRLCIIAVELEEYAVQLGKRRREKLDRVPLALRALWMFESPEDYAALLPRALPETFTASELRDAIHTPEMQARLYLSLLSRMNMIAPAGKRAREKLWCRRELEVPPSDL